MAVGASLSGQSVGVLANPPQGAGGPPLGLRGSIALGSGLRSGVVLVEVAGKAAAELQQAREAAAEAAREAARANAELSQAEEENTRAEREPEAQINTSQFGLSEGDAERVINAAQAAGESGEQAERGAFVDFAV